MKLASKAAREPIPLIDLRAQYSTIKEEIHAALNDVLDTQHLILGPQVKALEEEIARYCGAAFAVGVASGTDALLLALRACGVEAGDEIITTPFTFISTADTISALGATPVFVDIDPRTYNIDPSEIEAKITARTKAVIPVHLYCQSADMDSVLELAEAHKLRVIEDNAQALGATYKGKRTGTFGDAGCLSFFPSKNLGGYGDGGMIITSSEEIAKRVRKLRTHGGKDKYFIEEQGYNSRLDELQAAVLRVKLRYLEEWNGQRRELAKLYNKLLGELKEVTIPYEAEYGTPVYCYYTIRTKCRDRLRNVLDEQGIKSNIYYAAPLHLQPIFAPLGYRPGSLPEAERAPAEVLSLPIYPELMEEQIDRVVQAVIRAVQQGS